MEPGDWHSGHRAYLGKGLAPAPLSSGCLLRGARGLQEEETDFNVAAKDSIKGEEGETEKLMQETA